MYQRLNRGDGDGKHFFLLQIDGGIWTGIYRVIYPSSHLGQHLVRTIGGRDALLWQRFTSPAAVCHMSLLSIYWCVPWSLVLWCQQKLFLTLPSHKSKSQERIFTTATRHRKSLVTESAYSENAQLWSSYSWWRIFYFFDSDLKPTFAFSIQYTSPQAKGFLSHRQRCKLPFLCCGLAPRRPSKSQRQFSNGSISFLILRIWLQVVVRLY